MGFREGLVQIIWKTKIAIGKENYKKLKDMFKKQMSTIDIYLDFE